MQPDPDLPLLEDIAAGDKEALNELYARHGTPMLRYTTRLMGNHHTAEEVVQNVLLIVWKSASRFRQLSRVRTWLYGIARRQAYKTLERTPPSGEFLDETWSDDDELNESFEQTILVERLKLALDKLPQVEREALELVYYKGLNLAETAVYLNIPVNTVKSRLHRARTNLRKILIHKDIGNA